MAFPNLRVTFLIIVVALLHLFHEIGIWASQTVLLADVLKDQEPLLQLCFKTAIIGMLCGAAMAAHFTVRGAVMLSFIAAFFFAVGAGGGMLLTYMSALCVFFIFQLSYVLSVLLVNESGREEHGLAEENQRFPGE